ncbi:SDR family NAD(P)-dependent oxidoreductase [Streptomyces sp. NPDC048278]|uniref:SDR family NAD(P)-dependent oxidoreductase n=1 Tax=Streptomyces sp. NPDC048278 TaxID=3155809 RepID=UPI00342AD70C
MGKLSDKVAQATGADRRTGKAVTVRLVENSAAAAANYRRSASDSEEFVGELKERGARAVVLQADFADPVWTGRLVDQTVETFGKPDVLVSHAGTERFRSLKENTPDGSDGCSPPTHVGSCSQRSRRRAAPGAGGRIALTSSASAAWMVFQHTF